MDQYKLAMMYRSHDIRDYIYSKRAVVLSRLDICYKWPVITYHAEQDGAATGFYNPTVATVSDGIFDLRKVQSQCISKDIFARIFGLNPNERYYFAITEMYLDMNSDITTISLAWFNQVNSAKNILLNEFEEFFLFVEEDLASYLVQYPEDNIYGG